MTTRHVRLDLPPVGQRAEGEGPGAGRPHKHGKRDPPEDVAERTRLVRENLKKMLQAAGATCADVVRTDVFIITDMGDQDSLGEVMRPSCRGDYPASTLVEVRQLVDRRLEIEVSPWSRGKSR
jgi:enamine deaminase RidA (YjgF/YER057c/UK114 family)